MRGTLSRLRYFVADAWDECRHSPGANLLAVATLAAVLSGAALALLGLSNLARQVESWRGDLRVEVYLRDDASADHREALRGALSRLPGVEGVEVVDKAEALRRFRLAYGDLADLPAELGSNPLPASLEARLRGGPASLAQARGVVAAAQGRPGVEEVRFDQAWLDRLDSMLTVAGAGGTGLAVLVLVAVAFVMASVLRLAVLARQDEIDIMMLVGATPGFVRGPFLVAGLVQGSVAAILALGSLELARRVLLGWAAPRSLALLDLVAGRPLSPALAGAVLLAGAAVGVLSAFVAVRRVA